jgi:hemin uptake protein HemP
MRMSLRYNVRVPLRKDPSESESPAPVAAALSDLPTPPAVIDTASLFGRSNELRLWHRGQEYRMRITKAGKLILTK